MSEHTINRRILIQTAIAAPAFVGMVSGAESGDTHAVSEIVRRLIRRRDELLAQCNRLEARWRLIWPTLPDWCRSGPKYVAADGAPFGERVGWPAARVNLIKIREDQWLARPSPYDLRELYEVELCALSLETAVENYRLRSKQLRSRLHRRRSCNSNWGLPTATDWRPLDEEIER